jgi:DNA-binding winged helix-turn-helix (wHTH) protein
MKYIINNNIKYHEDRSELVVLNDNIPPVALTATLNRLLSALVRNNNLVLSRNTLLMQVWEAHGQVASGNNLNNTISILRKIFASLGEEDIIVTLPRQGFMFTAATLETADSLAADLPATELPNDMAQTLPVVSPRFARLKGVALSTLVLLAAVSGVWAWSDLGYSPIKTRPVGKIGSCDVQFITSYHKVGSGQVDLTHLKELLAQKNDIKCTEPATLFFYDTLSLMPNAAGRFRTSYFYYCPEKQVSSSQVQCENFYENKDL